MILKKISLLLCNRKLISNAWVINSVPMFITKYLLSNKLLDIGKKVTRHDNTILNIILILKLLFKSFKIDMDNVTILYSSKGRG